MSHFVRHKNLQFKQILLKIQWFKVVFRCTYGLGNSLSPNHRVFPPAEPAVYLQHHSYAKKACQDVTSDQSLLPRHVGSWNRTSAIFWSAYGTFRSSLCVLSPWQRVFFPPSGTNDRRKTLADDRDQACHIKGVSNVMDSIAISKTTVIFTLYFLLVDRYRYFLLQEIQRKAISLACGHLFQMSWGRE